MDLPAPLSSPLADFLRHLASEKRYSPHTCDNYRRDLTRLAHWLAGEGRRTWRELDNHELRRYVAGLSREGLSGRSIARHLSAIRRFYQFLVRERQASDNPALGLRAPKNGRRLPKVADVDQLAQLLDAPPDDPLEVRDLAMFELMYSSGLRLSELAGLDRSSVDLAGAEVRVLGKGDKERLLPVGRKALAALTAWLAVRAIGEAATRTASSDPKSIQEYLRGPQFELGAFKGVGVSFRDWDGQLRQPILLTGARMLVSVSPQKGFPHASHPDIEMDTLGIDEPESTCKM